MTSDPLVSPRTSEPHIVVIGAGFGGLELVKSLRKAPVRITIIDRRNHHLFQPLLYQVATGGLSPANISAPIRSILKRQTNVDVLLAEVTGFEPEAKRVLLSDGESVSYDSLVVATGSQYAYFGNDQWRPLAPGLKSVEDATTIRRRILSAFEAAEWEPDPERRDALMTFVVVGAGPTGVEMAGSIAEIARYTLRREFRHIDPTGSQVIILDASDRVLSQFPEELSEKAQTELENEFEIDVRLKSMVNEIHPDRVVYSPCDGGESVTVPTHTVVWAAGVRASPLAEELAKISEAETDRASRIIVNDDCSVPGMDGVYAVGDMAHFRQDDTPLPGLAPVAMQQGQYLAKHLSRAARGKTAFDKPFRYKDRGTMATVGRSFAVVDLGRIKFAGFFAWITWLFVHLLLIVRFENRLLILSQWAWNYVTFNRSARLITQVGGTPVPRYVTESRPVEQVLEEQTTG